MTLQIHPIDDRLDVELDGFHLGHEFGYASFRLG